MKIIVYSFCCGKIKKFPNILFNKQNVDWVMFTDSHDIKPNGWTLRYDIPYHNNVWDANKDIKWHPHKLFSAQYDYAIYLDAKVVLKIPPQELIDSISDKMPLGFAVNKHPFRDCVYDEAELLLNLHRGNSERIRLLIDNYIKMGFPKHFGLPETCLVISDLHSPISKIIQDELYRQYLTSETFRDQLIFPFVMYNLGYKMNDALLFNLHNEHYNLNEGKMLENVEYEIFTRQDYAQKKHLISHTLIVLLKSFFRTFSNCKL